MKLEITKGDAAILKKLLIGLHEQIDEFRNYASKEYFDKMRNMTKTEKAKWEASSKRVMNQRRVVTEVLQQLDNADVV